MFTYLPCGISFPMQNPTCIYLCIGFAFGLYVYFLELLICWPILYFSNRTVNEGRLQRLFSGYECLLFLQRTKYSSPHPHCYNLQQPLTPSPGFLMTSSSLMDTLFPVHTHTHTHPQAHAYT